TQPRTRPHHQHRTGGLRRTGFDHRDRVGLSHELRGVGDGFEIVDYRETGNAQAFADVADRHRPREIVIDDRIAQYVAGTRDGAMLHVRTGAELAYEILEHGCEAGPFGAGIAAVLQHGHGPAAVRTRTDQPDARVRATDVGRQKCRLRRR